MNTVFLLLAAHDGKAVLELEEVAKEYLGMSNKIAIMQKAREGNMPFPVFRLGESNKAPWLVSVEDLAAYIDKQREKAKKDFEALQKVG